MTNLNQSPFLQQLTEAETILIAGAGGGFDIYAGLPIILYLNSLGKQVIIANYSFTWLEETSATEYFPHCYEIKGTDHDRSGRGYFPERLLKSWLTTKGMDLPVFAFPRVGAKPLTSAYDYLVKRFSVDTIVLVDGGTDALMFGDEAGLGTPQEDACSVAAVTAQEVERALLVCVGFGIDAYHGVSHYRYLENVADCIRGGAFFGTWHLLQEMPEATAYREAVDYANDRMRGMESIVSNSIISALVGESGDFHRTRRTAGSELFINPLMTLYWCFEANYVAGRIGYLAALRSTDTIGEVNGVIARYQLGLGALRESRRLPG